MIVSKILVAVFGLSVGVLGGVVDTPTANAPVVGEHIVSVSGAGGTFTDIY